MTRPLILLAVLAGALVGPPSAFAAGSVWIHQCSYRDANGDLDFAYDDLLRYGSSGSVSVRAGCTAMDAPDPAIVIESSRPAGQPHSRDDFGVIKGHAPEDLAILGHESSATIEFRGYSYVSGTGDASKESWAFGYRLADPLGRIFERCGALPEPGASACNPDALPTVEQPVLPDPMRLAGDFRLEFGCLGTQDGSGCTVPRARPSMRVKSVKLRVRDEFPPQATFTGGLGEREIRDSKDTRLFVNATDRGLGVFQLLLYVDGELHAERDFGKGFECSSSTFRNAGSGWRMSQPCAKDPGTAAFGPFELPEGRHDVMAIVTDAGQNSRVLFSNPNVLIDLLPAPTPGTGVLAPSISGTPREGELLSLQPGEWDGHGLEVSHSYRWQRCDRSGLSCQDIPGAVGQDYRLTDLDTDRSVRGVVTGRSSEGETPVFLDPVGPVLATPGPTAQTPLIAGQPIAGSVIEARPGDWNGHGHPIDYAYQWQRCNTEGADCGNISAATSARYRLVTEDVNRRVRVVVRGSTAKGSTTASSQPFGPIGGLQCAGSSCEETPETGIQPAAGSGTGPASPPSQPTPGTADAVAETPNGLGASRGAILTAAGPGNKAVLRAAYRARYAIRGVLKDRRGTPIVGALLDVTSRDATPGSPPRLVGTVRTERDGSFMYLTQVGPSRIIRIAYRAFAEDLEHATERDVELIVAADIAFSATRAVRAGRPIEFRGTIPGLRQGTRVQLQAKDGRRWRTFQIVPIGANGRYFSRYTVRRASGPLSFLFRVRYVKNPSLPLESATSKSVRVRVRP